MQKAHNRINMIGKTYNSWTVIAHVETKNKIAYYQCQCNECHKIYIVDGRNIRTGRSKRCTSCGVKHTAKNQTGVVKAAHTPEQMRLNYLYNIKKKDAKKRGKKWTLTKRQFKNLIFLNCEYCGVEPSTTVNVLKNHELHRFWVETGNITYNGIDRVDSSKGYEPDNCVSCCWKCNNAKNNLSFQEFSDWVQKVYTHMFAKI